MLKALLLSSPDVIYGFDLLGKFPNLGLVSIAGNVDRDIAEVKVADLVLVNEVKATVKEFVRSIRPDLVGISCMSFQYSSALEIAKMVKEMDKSIYMAMGGYHPTLLYDEMMKSRDFAYIDFIIRGEGEATFNDLMKALSGRLSFGAVDGLTYKHRGEAKHNRPRSLLDVKSIQLPDRGARVLREGFHAFGKRSDVVEASRGCTFDCNYCCISHMYGKHYRAYPIERVIMDIEDAKKQGAEAIFFVDDNITLDVKRLGQLCDAIIAHGHNDVHYLTQASVQGIASSEELIEKMAKAGFKATFLGIESLSKRNLAFLAPGKNRVGYSDSTERAVRYLKKYRMIVAGGFILANPEDTEEDFWDVFNMAKGLKVDLPLFFLSTPYPKTRLREDLMKMHLVTNMDDYSKYSCFSANIRAKSLSSDDVDFLEWRMYQRWFNEWGWFRWNNIRAHYPQYLLKVIMKLYPRHLMKCFLLRLGIKKEKDLYVEDQRTLGSVHNVHGRVS